MLGINYNKYNEPVRIDIEVCKRTFKRTKLAYVNGYDKKITYNFGEIDELNFTVPKFIRSDNKKIENPSYKYLKGDMMLKVTILDNVQYFVVYNCKEIDDERGVRKEVLAFSYEHSFINKRLTIKGVKKLYDITAPEDSVLHEIIRLNPSWSVAYVNPEVNKFREYNIEDTSCLMAFSDLQKELGCVFLFDTVERTIDVYKRQLFTKMAEIITLGGMIMYTNSELLQYFEREMRSSLDVYKRQLIYQPHHLVLQNHIQTQNHYPHIDT